MLWVQPGHVADVPGPGAAGAPQTLHGTLSARSLRRRRLTATTAATTATSHTPNTDRPGAASPRDRHSAGNAATHTRAPATGAQVPLTWASQPTPFGESWLSRRGTGLVLADGARPAPVYMKPA